jgi:hypothetical protein
MDDQIPLSGLSDRGVAAGLAGGLSPRVSGSLRWAKGR